VPAVPDIALVSLGTTPGLMRADDAFAGLAEAAGVSCELVRVRVGRASALRRHATVTDAVEALAARRAASGLRARAVVYSTVTAALLQRHSGPYAVRFDSPAALNRLGPAGAWQRAREKRVMAGATVLLPWGDAAAAAIPREARGVPAIALRVPVTAASGSGTQDRDIEALAYAGYPEKRGLDILVRAWAKVSAPGALLVVAGIERARALRWLERRGIPEPPNVEWPGLLDPAEWQAKLARARLFVNASRREDHGLSQLEALAAGAVLVTVPSAGPYEALPLARAIDERLVAAAIDENALAVSLAAGLQVDPSAYAASAAPLLEPYRPEAVRRVFEQQVLPALGLR
jgi:glycosyltransferase involved in cell wall biosynthesis